MIKTGGIILHTILIYSKMLTLRKETYQNITDFLCFTSAFSKFS